MSGVSSEPTNLKRDQEEPSGWGRVDRAIKPAGQERGSQDEEVLLLVGKWPAEGRWVAILLLC